MKRIILLALLLLLGGCAVSPDCYVGLSVFPPGPFVHCGMDAEPDEEVEEVSLDV